MILLAFIVAIVCAIVSANIASGKGRDAFGYGLLGFFFGPIGLIVAAAQSPRTSREAEVIANSLKYGTMKKCPACAEAIKAEAIKCRFCGTDLPAPEATAALPSQ